MKDSKKFEDEILRWLLKYRALRILFISLAFLSLLNTAKDIIYPTYSYFKPDVYYILNIKPDEDQLVDHKYSFWAGFIAYERFHPLSYSENPYQLKYSHQNMLERCFQVLGFKAENKFYYNNELDEFLEIGTIRERLEGFLEKKGKSNLRLYLLGFKLNLLINELQKAEPSELIVKEYISDLSLLWKKIRSDLSYKFPSLKIINHSGKNFIYSQPKLMEDAINSLEEIRSFYGSL